MRLSSLISILVLFSLPASALAQCSFTYSCGGGFGGGTKRFSSKQACQSALSRAKTVTARQGGGCSYSACTCTGGTGAAGGAGALSPADQMMMGLVGSIIQSIFPSPQQRAAREAERAAQGAEAQRQLEEALRQAAEAESRRRERFEAEKTDLLGTFKGRVPTENIDWKGKAVFGEFALKFDKYHKRETERREVFARTTDVWCKLRPPLEPYPPFVPIPKDQYERMKAYYHQRKAEWDQRCKEMQAEAASRPIEAWKETKKPEPAPKGKTKPRPLLMACSVCWSEFQKTSGACGPAKTNLDRLVCVNDLLDKWVLCIGRCRPDTGQAVEFSGSPRKPSAKTGPGSYRTPSKKPKAPPEALAWKKPGPPTKKSARRKPARRPAHRKPKRQAEAKSLSRARNVMRCALQPFLGQVNDKDFARELQEDVTRAFHDFDPGNRSEDIGISRDTMLAEGGTELQIVLKAHLRRPMDDPDALVVDVQSSVWDSAHPAAETQTVVKISPSGEILQHEMSPEVAECIGTAE